MSKKQKMCILMIAVAVVFAVVNLIFLPDTVVVQLSYMGDASNELPKWVGIVMPFAMSVSGAVLTMIDERDKNWKTSLLIAIGYFVSVFEFVVNVILKK